jgi:hypothetical protein
MDIAETAQVTAYAVYCNRLRMEAPTLEELASPAFTVGVMGPEGTILVFQACTEAGERGLTEQEDVRLQAAQRAWSVDPCWGYTGRYDSPSGPEGAGRDPEADS